jgi:hypothetical protein
MPPKPPVCSLHIYHTSTTPLPHLYLLFRPAPKTPLERPRPALLIRLLADVLEMMHVLRLLSALIQIVPRPFAKTTSASASRGHLARLVRLDATRAAQLDANLYDQSRWTRAAENSLPSDDNAAVNGHNRPDQSSRAGCRASVIDPSLTLSSLAQTSLLASSSCTPLFSPTPCRALPPLPTCPARPSPPARAGRASCCYKSMRAGSLGAGAAAGPRP